ncbi:hypothetical protein F2P81_007908 [Scophthalmus maximus]|uniref:Uncharacterized protein n=1 Tax=Scophthalmus maximus TaxID=52904 RepID=A0A6A4T0S3_SCOMX|nr:hypothetical protein F2P81_007908 [Scophthalmus maximus]
MRPERIGVLRMQHERDIDRNAHDDGKYQLGESYQGNYAERFAGHIASVIFSSTVSTIILFFIIIRG